ncbi:MAG: sugar phosphate isomerase/epimerase [Oscillospiraceae bacterium]|nr:sugar phosphate isomerase/epimerase [Oscillospiraceae bacterium]
MKTIMNFTTSYYDLDRYEDNNDLKAAYKMHGIDGIELMQSGEDEKEKVNIDDVIGIHLKYFHYWTPVWKGDTNAILAEYDSMENCEMVFGGVGREGILSAYEQNLNFARHYSPEYAVFHVADICLQDSITRNYTNTDLEVIDATIELVNEILPADSAQFQLLFENLWWPGMTMKEPDMVEYLLSKIEYGNCGVMLDIGHLLHTNTSLRSLEEGIDYIYNLLEKYNNLDFVKGIHLHQTLSGQYVEDVLKNPLVLDGNFSERYSQTARHVMNIDNHKPFISERIQELVEYIAPQFLVYEFISSTREEHEGYLREQATCFS